MVGKLTDKQCKNAKADAKAIKLADGGGMFLHVMPNGNKYWRMKYRYLGKEKLLALGVYPVVSLSDARDKRLSAKKMLDQGLDPNENKKQVKLEKQVNYENNYENIAREWHEQKRHAWKDKHAGVILTRLESLLFNKIGSRPIRDLTPPELLAVIRPIEAAGKRDLAHRMLQHSGQIFRYAVATGRAERDITQDLRGALQPLKTISNAYLNEKQIPAFLKELEQYDTKHNGGLLTKLAFKLLILTFVRSSELRYARWNEIDWDKKQWRIPAERMKMKEQHIVPLAKQCIAILKQISEITSNKPDSFILPSQKNIHKPMSENTFLRAIQIMGYRGQTTGHGFRAMASTILNEQGFPPDHIERQLAHAERNQVRGVYNYAEYLPQRHKMMQWWGDYLEKAGLYD